MHLNRFGDRADAELNRGDVLCFPDTAHSRIASRHYRVWTVARVFSAPDGRTYVRLTATADPTVTKVVLAAILWAERFEREPLVEREPLEPACEPPLPLRSRRALAAMKSLVAAAAE